MELAAELHFPLKEILSWEIEEFEEWVAFYEIMDERRQSRRNKNKNK